MMSILAAVSPTLLACTEENSGFARKGKAKLAFLKQESSAKVLMASLG